jgi:hypothetical protein
MLPLDEIDLPQERQLIEQAPVLDYFSIPYFENVKKLRK